MLGVCVSEDSTREAEPVRERLPYYKDLIGLCDYGGWLSKSKTVEQLGREECEHDGSPWT